MIKSQDELNTCNDGKRKSDVLIATIEKCEKLEKQLRKVREPWEYEVVVNQIFTLPFRP